MPLREGGSGAACCYRRSFFGIDSLLRFACEVSEGHQVMIIGLQICPPLSPGLAWLWAMALSVEGEARVRVCVCV